MIKSPFKILILNKIDLFYVVLPFSERNPPVITACTTCTACTIRAYASF